MNIYNMNLIGRRKALEAVRQQKISQLQQLETTRNNLLTDIVQIEGKIDLLKELENESPDKPSEAKKEEKVEGSK